MRYLLDSHTVEISNIRSLPRPNGNTAPRRNRLTSGDATSYYEYYDSRIRALPEPKTRDL